MSDPSPSSVTGERTTLIEFPCDFPIKVMGIYDPGFVPSLVELAKQFDPQFNPDSITLRASRNGTYQGATLTIRALNQTQLDGLYRCLTQHPLVKVVL
jgi:putative lipoic acid-binding regulatory protein